MTASTTKGWPYVLPADAIADYPVTSQAIATKADASIPFALAAGAVTCNFPNATQSTPVTVTLPVGRFTVAPAIFFGTQSALFAGMYFPRLSGPNSAASFQVVLNAAAAQSGTQSVTWLAVQMGAGAMPG